MIKIYKINATKQLPDSEVEILAEITAQATETYKEKAFKKIKEGLVCSAISFLFNC